jgi:hypothetical protein
VSQARLLAHYESLDSPHETLVDVEVCRELARRLCAEKLSRRLYRLLAPDSIYPVKMNFPQPHYGEGKAAKLEPAEISGLKFQHPNPAQLRRVRRREIVVLLGEYVWSER